jgi:hypothetical protein
MTKTNKLYGEQWTFQDYIICQIFCFLYSVEYKVVHFEILHVSRIHHWLPREFYFNFYKTLKDEF